MNKLSLDWHINEIKSISTDQQMKDYRMSKFRKFEKF